MATTSSATDDDPWIKVTVEKDGAITTAPIMISSVDFFTDKRFLVEYSENIIYAVNVDLKEDNSVYNTVWPLVKKVMDTDSIAIEYPANVTMSAYQETYVRHMTSEIRGYAELFRRHYPNLMLDLLTMSYQDVAANAHHIEVSKHKTRVEIIADRLENSDEICSSNDSETSVSADVLFPRKLLQNIRNTQLLKRAAAFLPKNHPKPDDQNYQEHQTSTNSFIEPQTADHIGETPHRIIHDKAILCSLEKTRDSNGIAAVSVKLFRVDLGDETKALCSMKWSKHEKRLRLQGFELQVLKEVV